MDVSFQRTAGSDEWYTPREILDALGPFDLDPCAPEKPLWKTAERMVDKDEDGLSVQWEGRVWCNPPYSKPLLHEFCRRMAEHGDGVLLVFARTDNADFQEMARRADAVLLLRKRIRFVRPDGTRGRAAGCGSALFAFGKDNVRALEECGLEGVLMNNRI